VVAERPGVGFISWAIEAAAGLERFSVRLAGAVRVCTGCMVICRANVRHIERDHPERGITRAEVTEVLTDAERMETSEVRGDTTYHPVVGRTAKGRLLVVVWIEHPNGRFPIHARPAGRRAARRYYR